MIIFSVVMLIGIIHFLFIRYFPVYGLRHIKNKMWINNRLAIDIRDYNEAYKDPVNSGINIPIAYLKRYYCEIPNNELVVIASNCMERNVGVRFLRKKGFKVVGYLIPSEKEEIVNGNKLSTESYC